jgi:hypothetical protein
MLKAMDSHAALLGATGQDVSSTPELNDLLLAIDDQILDWVNRGFSTDKLEKIGRVLAHAAETFGSAQKAERWLKRPNPLLDGRPLDRIEYDAKAIDDELTRIDHGVYV